MLRREKSRSRQASEVVAFPQLIFFALGSPLALGGFMFNQPRLRFDEVTKTSGISKPTLALTSFQGFWELAPRANMAPESLKQVGREVLHDAPTKAS
jgi:hypothetical protein